LLVEQLRLSNQTSPFDQPSSPERITMESA
jgi:hypothetical protein